MPTPTETTTPGVQPEPPQGRGPASSEGLQTDSGWKQFHQRNPWLRLGLICAGIALLVGGLVVWRYLGSYESTDDAQIVGHLNPVSARVSGQVMAVLIRDNQYVSAGTPLVQIDPRDYQVAVDRARADYANALATADAARASVPVTSETTGSQVSSAEADIENANAGIAAARQQFDAAQAQLQAAQANNVKAQSDLGRYKQLVDKQEISEQQYDQAVAGAKANAAAVEGARASAAAAQQQVKQAQSRLAQAQAGARSAATGPQKVAEIRARAEAAQAAADLKKAALAQAELDLKYTLIVSPINGVVSDRSVEVGQNVQPGQELMKIIDLDDVWVEANLKETQLKRMRPGQKVTISVDGTGKEYKGFVESIAGASGEVFSLLPPENATGNYVKVVQRVPVKILFEQGQTREHDLRPGMSAEPKVWVR